MKIKGFLCTTTAATNEEYKEVLKKRNIWIAVLALTGVLIAGSAFLAHQSQTAALPDQALGVYCGFGTGIFLAGILLFMKNIILLHNEEKLKQSRLESADERLDEINKKAARATLMIMMFVITAAGMIFGIFEPVLFKAVIFVIDMFLFSYIIAFVYYKKKM